MKPNQRSASARPRRSSVLGRAILASLLTSGAVALSCASPEGRTIFLAGTPEAGPSPSFAEEDSGATPESHALTEYCPSTACTMPFVTCPASQFPCDVNLMTDPHNCGSCGFDCDPRNDSAEFDCISGRCTMKCTKTTIEGFTQSADCNGMVDDQCEITLGTNANCNGCGDRCDDPAKPCMPDFKNVGRKCGCDDGLVLCQTSQGPRCLDVAGNDKNCGSCGIACDGSSKPEAPPFSYWGCADSECGKLKCKAPHGDCDNDLSTDPSSNGCETELTTSENCGTCGNACAPGQQCLSPVDVYGNPLSPRCVCGPGETLCGGACVNLLTDLRHCGACENECRRYKDTIDDTVVPVCRYGSCSIECRLGFADCNGDVGDGCEAHLTTDQQNCGACGNACNALIGQPCIGGQCAVHPCDEEEPEGAR